MSSDPYDDDDDDHPRRRRREDDEHSNSPRRRRDEDDDEDHPRRRHYDDDRDDFDDAPPRRRQGGAGDGLAIASMIVGIFGSAVAVVGWCCCGYFGTGASVLIGLLAVILGFVSRSQGSRSGMGLTGIILGFVAILIGVIMTILLIIGIGWMQANQGKFGPGGPGGPPPGQRNKL
ncbi:MAG TPA: hypothetical protein VKD71_12660 [Gemmataceae bacterium]|nr:hypothetical protein [Gemmataceae bacterium]